MKRTRFTEEQIIGVLKERDLGAKVSDLCRKYGVSDGTIYNWKSKYGGMDVGEAKRLRQLEEENAKLKRLLAEFDTRQHCAQGSSEKNSNARRIAAGGRPS